MNIIFEADETGSYEKSITKARVVLGDKFLPIIRRLVDTLESADRALRCEDALRRAVILAGVLFVLLVAQS